MNRRALLGTLAAAPWALSAATNKPNIVLLFADDMGQTDLGCYGGKEIPTPNIDSIANNGVRLTDGYVSCPYCSPTRAGMMTGRYQTHFGHEFNPGPAEAAVENFGLPLTETAMAQRLKDLGYRTGMFGKWHLGYREEFHPLKRGFDEFYGFLVPLHLGSACFWQDIFRDVRRSQYPRASDATLAECPTLRAPTCLVPATPG